MSADLIADAILDQIPTLDPVRARPVLRRAYGTIAALGTPPTVNLDGTTGAAVPIPCLRSYTPIVGEYVAIDITENGDPLILGPMTAASVLTTPSLILRRTTSFTAASGSVTSITFNNETSDIFGLYAGGANVTMTAAAAGWWSLTLWVGLSTTPGAGRAFPIMDIAVASVGSVSYRQSSAGEDWFCVTATVPIANGGTIGCGYFQQTGATVTVSSAVLTGVRIAA